ncbi:Uncharacterised protein [Brucella neotomae]|nr:Uncharacterised protein [Brucella neotomae]
MSKRSESQPDMMVPIRSNAPMTARIPAAPTGAMPKSPHSEIQCVWMRPFVEKPQTKKVRNRTQKVGVEDASRSVTSGEASIAPKLLRGSGSGSGARRPKGLRPTSAG